MTVARGVVAAALASAVLVIGYAGLGGGDFEPSSPPDPCALRGAQPDGRERLTATLERIGLNALSGAACELGVSRERLLLALAGDERLGVDRERRGEAFRTGLAEAIDAEERAGRLGAAQALLLRQALTLLPVDAVLERLFGEGL